MYPNLYSTHLWGLLHEPFTLHTYGLLIASGFLIGMFLAKRQAEREGEDGEQVVDLAFSLLIAGLVGARLVFIFTKLDEFWRDPWQVVMFWRGGLVWYGGFLGAVAYVAWYARRKQLPFFKYVDILIPSMALAHTFGRFGCLMAGCCFGAPTNVPWGIVFPHDSMAHTQQVISGLIAYPSPPLPVHATQLYEAAAELLLFALLIWLRPYKRFHGQLFLVWLALYPIIRSTIELYRGDKERGIYFLLSTSQYLSILVALGALAVHLYLRHQRQQSRVAAS